MDDNEWDLEFSIQNWTQKHDDKLNLKNNFAYAITNTKGQFTIMATVIKAIKELVNKQEPDTLTFTAKEKSRQKLYNTLANTIGKQLNFKTTKSNSNFKLYYNG